MTKEPIMIDDKYWEKKYADLHIRLTNENAELREQLKHKEQECEDLREELEWVHGIKDKLNKDNEQLKKSVRSNKDKRKRAIERYIRLKEFTDKNFNQFEIDMEKAENENLKQTLQEIKEIVCPKNQLIITDSPIILKIQEKISEVLDV